METFKMDVAIFDITKMCRTCLKTDDGLKSLFADENFQGITMQQMISECTIYPVKQDDLYPNKICDKCIQDATIAYEFKKQCEKAYETLSSVLDIYKVKEDIKTESTETEIIYLKGVYMKTDECDQETETNLQEKCTQTSEQAFHPCEKCEEKFFSIDALREHRIKDHKGSENKCRVCSKVYTRITHLKRHLAAAHPEMGFMSDNQCNNCGKKFTRPERLKKHLTICKQDAPNNDELATSENDVDMTDDLKCEKCGTIFDADDFLKEHKCNTSEKVPKESDSQEVVPPVVEVQHSTIEHTFPSENNIIADEIFNDINDSCVENNEDVPDDSSDDDLMPLSELRNQSKLEENTAPITNEINKNNGENQDQTPYTDKQKPKENKEHACPTCGRIFTRATHLKRHILTHSEEKPYSCNICKKGFTRVDHLNIHMHHHSDVKPFVCDVCGKGFIRSEYLRKHKESRHGHKAMTPKTEFCEICKKGFTTGKYLQIHMKSHMDKKWNCKFCSEKFKSKPDLTEHMKMHTNEKPFLCSECGLRFVRNDYLVIHMRRHKGEKPFKCKFCGKGFPRATDLTVHERYHTGEKTHLCTVCGKGFQRAYNLLVHMRVHTGERPYQCSHCPKSFAQGNDLKAHVRRHTGERFKCELCGDGFIQGYHLTQHKRNSHGIDMKSHIRRVEKFTTPTEQQQQMKAIQQQGNTEPIPNDNTVMNEPITNQSQSKMLPEAVTIKIEDNINSPQTISLSSEQAEMLQSAQSFTVVDGTNVTMITPVFFTQLQDKVKFEPGYE